MKCTNWGSGAHRAPYIGPCGAPGANCGPVSLSAKVCEEKLRYAAYNCVAIDTDMSPWEE